MVIIDESKVLIHYGILRKSGRYPWGSGGTTEQRSRTFLEYINDLKRRLGWGDVEIAKSVGMSTTDLRAAKAIAKNAQKAAQIAMAQRLKDKGYSNVEAARRMGIPESSYRALLAPGAQDKADVLTATSNMLREEVAQKKYLDVGSGVENWVGVSKERKDIAISMLKEEGYTVYYVKVPQLGTNKETTMKVLVPPGTTYSEVYRNRGEIKSISNFSEDGGRTYYGIVEPLSISPDRLAVRYAEDGGGALDGVIYVRPGVDDLSLGGSRYAQVRVKVGDGHYVKGMAIYKDDLPDGVDLMFNTNKSDTGQKTDALKPLENDPDNPFGSYIRRQLVAKREDGTEYATSAMNIVNEEGRWGGGAINPKTGEPVTGWSKSIATQVLSKQSPELAKTQLDVTMEHRQREFNEIMELTNPAVRRKLLEEFADGTDSAAVHLKAASLPRQRWEVILPIDSLPDTQIYAPNFNNGERVALIRYPHGGTFEIPELTVNNRHGPSKKMLGDAKDAVGINSKVAERLSGADFDGDTVLVIPNNQNRIRTSPALQQLRDFDPRSSFPPYDGMPTIDGGRYNAATKKVEYGSKGPTDRKQHEMGNVSNLITDMTIKGASHDKIARAVKHSMVVIDSEKHALNYKLSYEVNGIRALKEEFQRRDEGEGRVRTGAATLVSRAKSPTRVPERKARRASKGGPVDPVTGKKVYEPTNRTYVNRKGETVPSTIKLPLLSVVDDAHTISSGTPMERLYADHSNRLKALANEARLAAINTPRAPYSSSAAKTYEAPVRSLTDKLDLAVRNRPLERQAQVLANATLRQKRDENPNMDPDTLRKIKFQALEEARRRTGADRRRIQITQDEWDAIQAGAISNSKLNAILSYADMDVVRQLATPRTPLLMSPAMNQRAQAMAAMGYTRADIAEQLGVSVTTLLKSLSGDNN